MTLLVEDLTTSQELDENNALAVTGGDGSAAVPSVGQLSGQLGNNSVVGAATTYGALNTTVVVPVQIAPQISVQTANVVDLSTITDITNVIASAIG